jgi:hypothetical protein
MSNFVMWITSTYTMLDLTVYVIIVSLIISIPVTLITMLIK